MARETLFVDANGVRLGYQIHATSRLKRPLLFVHGYGLKSTGEVYASLFAELSERFTIYALDLRGHGASSAAVDGWSLEALADDVVAVAAALRIEGCDYVGHSIGGFTGMFAEIRHPRTFRSLSLLATSPAIAGRDTPAEIGELFIEQAADVEAMHRAFEPFYVRPEFSRVRLAAELAATIHPEVHRAFFADFARTRLTEQLASIDVPVLAINGRRDVVIDPEEQHRTATGLRNCEEITLAAEGHMLPIEAPEVVAREIMHFCLGQAHSPRRRR